MKVVVPVAGIGSRLKPHTFTVPKPLMDVAGKPILDYIIEDIAALNPNEVIFVVGYMRNAIERYVTQKFPGLNAQFVHQEIRDGNGSAIRLALDHIHEDDELFVVFGDTMVDFDYSSLIARKKDVDALVLAMEVDDPQHYGIMTADRGGQVLRVEEKPQNPQSNLAIIGAYYFASLLQVKKELNEFYERKETVGGEYNIIQVIEQYIKMKDVSVKAVPVKKWFDCGRPEVLLAANKYFLEKVSRGVKAPRDTSIVIPPSYVAKTAKIENSIIGPYASIGENVVVKNSCIENSIVSSKAVVENMVLKNSLVGKEAKVCRSPSEVNIGERSEFSMH